MSEKSGIAKPTVDMRKCGGEIDAVVYSLIDHAYDRSEAVLDTIMVSLNEIASHKPELVLTAIASYVTKRSDKIDTSHRIQLLKIAARILDSHAASLSPDVAKDVVAFATFEMVGSAEVKAEWQTPASAMLVCLAIPFPNVVIDSLLSTFKPGVEPHYFTVKTFADVAAANSVHLTMRLREVLNRLVPVLGGVKRAPMMWVFATAFGRFAEAVGLFHTDATPEMRAEVQPSAFAADMASAFDVIFSRWLASSETKVRFAVAEALGFISGVLSDKDFGSRLERLAPTYLQMLKKEKPSEHLAVVRGLSAMLAKGVSDDRFFETGILLNQVLGGLHELVCVPPADPVANPNALRTMGEVLRCFEVLCRALPDQVLSFVVNRFQIKQTLVRIGSLVILRQFVNSLDSVLKERRSIIMSAVTTLVSEPEIGVRKTVLQLITAMANQGYLALDGGETLVRFVVEQCAAKAPAAAAGSGASTATAQINLLKRAAEHTLGVLATKVPTAVPVMWPFLLELIDLPALTPAASVMFKAIGDVGAQVVALHGDAKIDFTRAVNVPSPQVIMTRLCVMLSIPTREKHLGVNTCAAMGVLAESLHPALGTYWAETVPAMAAHLTERATDDDFAVNKWQDTVLKVWRESINVIDNEQWLNELATVVSRQYVVYKKDNELQRVVHRFLGAVLSRIQNKALIDKLIATMVNSVDHTNEAQQRGCAQGLGMVAAPHLDTVLPKVTDLLTKVPEDQESSGGFFSFVSKKKSSPEDPVKATAVLAYGYITAYANPELVISRLDVHILHNIIPLLCLPPADPKAPRTPLRSTPILRVQLAKALDLIGKAVHPTRLPESQAAFRLKKRDDLVRGLLLMIDDRESNKDKESRPTAELRLLVLGTIATLTLLEPKYPKSMLDSILDHLVPMFSLLPDKENDAAAAAAEENGDDEPLVKPETAGQKLMTYVHALLQSIIQTDPSVELVLRIIAKLEPLLSSKNATVRSRAISAYLVVLKKFVPKVSQEKIPQQEQCFPELGKRLAPVLARVGDSVEATRVGAVECTQALLYLDQLLNNPHDPKPRPEVKLLSELKERIAVVAATPEQEVAAHAAATTTATLAASAPVALEADSPSLQTVPPSIVANSEARYPVVDDVISLVCAVVVPGEVVSLARTLIPRFADHDAAAALGAARVVLDSLAARGSDIKPELPDFVAALLEVLKKLHRIEVQRACLSVFCTLTRLHFSAVMAELLKSPTPLPGEVQLCITALVDPALEATLPPVASLGESIDSLPRHTIDHLITVINDTPLDLKTPTPVVMAATCALSTVFQKGSADTAAISAMAALSSSGAAASDEAICGANKDTLADIVRSKYAPLFATLMMRTGTAHKVDEHTSSRQAVRALREFFKCAEQDKVLSGLLNAEVTESVDSSEEKDTSKGAVWSKLDSPTYDDSISLITKVVCQEMPSIKAELLAFLPHFYSQQAYMGQRVVATSMLAEFVSHSGSEADAPLQSDLIKFVLPRVADKTPKVRKQALRGLGNLVTVWSPRVAEHATSVISVLSGATEDSEAEVAAEAVSSLTRVAQVVESTTMAPNLVSICFRMRATFDRKQIKVRRAAFSLFAELCRFATPVAGAEHARGEFGDTVNENFHDQLHTNVPVYLVHVNDEDKSVSKSALAGLVKVCALLDPSLHELVSEAEVGVDGYDTLVSEFTRLYALHYGNRLRGTIDSLTSYYASSWVRVRANAAYATACVVRHSLASNYADARKKLNLHSIALGLMKMLDQESDLVRNKVSKGLSLLYDT